MNSEKATTEKISFWLRLRRRVVRFFLPRGSCTGSCNDCVACPWIDKEKYSFEIKKRE
ncbi:MAG: hypothetical protein H7644_12695 [Candidatus Heimdallarchaeota archaeon]|nr:hypothetical protein [Candidatus Heimdallarchaeota archaeon]MCK5144619.1 hypothetical protein [Candidatus Heimdallarchaeota archaeon]